MKTPRRVIVSGLVAAAAYPALLGIRTLAGGDQPPTPPTPPAPPASPPAPLAAASPAPAPAVPAQPAPAPAPPQIPPYQRYAVNPPRPDGRPIICIVMDDLGVMHRGTERALALPAPMTLSWFPFAQRLPEQVAGGADRGHEATLHMPMQAFGNSIAWTGPNPLRVDLPPEENLRRLKTALDAVPHTVGLNNHMGSVATKSVPLMQLVAQETKSRGMLFLDSLTIGGSVGKKEAELAGVPADARDLFIDNSEEPAKLREALGLIEQHARKHGNVIAIGHPRTHTLDALEWWMPTLASKGFVLWPLAATMALRAGESASVTHA
ncbi:MAG TPA: divergent polysaccharide deacetylase family protein [Acetobacteraceae bacterium]|nr:divergent polysaccharide deacetylase family protein [Acetobacteraceae bacterium]